MKLKRFALSLFVIFIWTSMGWTASDTDSGTPPTSQTKVDLETILNRIEKRYAGNGFSAGFYQTSMLKALDITDKAYGRVFIKHPGKMRWEYEYPDNQSIITDGETIWVYRPADYQVMIGKAEHYFGDGKGASFLSDIQIVRKRFHISIQKSDAPDTYRLKLVPKDNRFDISSIFLDISKTTFDILAISTLNAYNDETRIQMKNFEFNQNPDDSMFRFDIPEGADVLQLTE